MPVASQRLNEVALGQTVRVVRIHDLAIAKRLFAMGLLPGTSITLIRRGLFRGSCYVQSEALTLALRNREAAAIEIA